VAADWAGAFQHVMRSERAAVIELYSNVGSMLSSQGFRPVSGSPAVAKVEKLGRSFLLDGWADQARALYCRTVQDVAVELYDSRNRVARPAMLENALPILEGIAASRHPRDNLVAMALPNFVKAYIGTCRAQIKIDQARIVIALERFRLKHGRIPSSLEELGAGVIGNLPHDLIGGGRYRYRLLPKDRYALWSVGWNEVDDGGTVASDQTEGDWVWFSFAKDEVVDENGGAKDQAAMP